MVEATGLSRRAVGSADLGFALALRLRAGSRTKVLILSQKSGRHDSVPVPHSQELTTRASQTSRTIADSDLQSGGCPTIESVRSLC